jgi:sugar/nucleoside kinase (ribokinase family)
LQLQVLDQIERPELVFADTMNFWISSKRPELLEVLKRVDGLVLNDAEARQLSGEPNLVKAAQRLRALGPRLLIIKKGEHGALLFEPDGVFSAPAYPLEFVYDPTGAGDTFAGGFLGSYVQSTMSRGSEPGPALRKAMIDGSALASYCVEDFGLERLKKVAAADLDARVAAFRRLSAF